MTRKKKIFLIVSLVINLVFLLYLFFGTFSFKGRIFEPFFVKFEERTGLKINFDKIKINMRKIDVYGLVVEIPKKDTKLNFKEFLLKYSFFEMFGGNKISVDIKIVESQGQYF